MGNTQIYTINEYKFDLLLRLRGLRWWTHRGERSDQSQWDLETLPKTLKLWHTQISCTAINHCFSKSLLVVQEGIWDSYHPCSLYEGNNPLEISTPHSFDAYTLLFASTGCIYTLLFTPLGPLGRHCKLLLFSLEQYRCGLIIYKIRSIHPLSMIHIRSQNRPLIPPPFQFYAVRPLSFDPDIVHLYLHFNSIIAVHLIPKSSLDLHLFTRISISYLSIIDPL